MAINTQSLSQQQRCEAWLSYQVLEVKEKF